MISVGLSSLSARILDVFAPMPGDDESAKEIRANLETLIRQTDARCRDTRSLEENFKTDWECNMGAGRVLSEEGRNCIDKRSKTNSE
jgi:hypothetical protein